MVQYLPWLCITSLRFFDSYIHFLPATSFACLSLLSSDHALFNASPKMVRRIKNQFISGSSGSKKPPDRNSYSGGETIFTASLPARKQHNRSETLPSANPAMSALLSPSSQPAGPSRWGRTGSSGTLQSTRPRETSLGSYGDLNPHARYGGRDDVRREHVGSIWRDQKGRSSERREGQSRSQLLSSHPPPPLIAHQKELLTSYHPQTLPYHRHSHSSPSHEPLHRSTTLPASPEHRGSLHHQPISSPEHKMSSHHSMRPAPTSSSPVTRRKISYNLAVTEGYAPTHRGGAYHHRRLSDQLPYQDELREGEFSRSYAPPSSGKSGTYFGHPSSSGSRGHHLYGNQGQRSHSKPYHH